MRWFIPTGFVLFVLLLAYALSGCAAIRPTCVCVCQVPRPNSPPALDYLEALHDLDVAAAAASEAAQKGGADR